MAHSLNGLGATAKDWIEVLETLTHRSELRCLTMLRWSYVLSEHSLSRSIHAWCPLCYQAGVVYDQLLWSLVTVEVCPRHKRRLETSCPHCQRQHHPLDSRSRPGFCCRCKKWLGFSEGNNRDNGAPLEYDEIAYKLWVAKQMGENLLTKASVSLNHELINQSLSRMPVTPLIRSHKNGVIRRAFLTALKCDPAPSVHEFSESLGYKNPDFLYSKYSDLCKKLTARYRKSRRYLKRIQPPNRIQADDETIKFALQRALNEPVTSSLQEIRKRLGYQSKYVERYILQRRFPELCQAILERKAAQRVKYQKHLRRKLKSILGEEPAPTLHDVAKRLGFRGNNYLLEHYPELCRAIVRRHSEYRKAQFNGFPDKLRAILREEPPVTLRAAAIRLGRNASYLGSRFPDVCQAISKRYVLFKREQSLENKKQAVKRLRAMALNLDSTGVYPSLKRIKAVFRTPVGLTYEEAGAVLRKLRSQFKSIRGG